MDRPITRCIIAALALACAASQAAPTLDLYGGHYAAVKRASHDHYDLAFDVAGADLDALFAATSPKEHYRLTVAKGAMTLSTVTGGRARVLATAALPQTKAASHHALIKRRPHFVTICWDNRRVITALDDSHFKGVFCVRAGQAKVQRVRCQPVEPIFFTDDFMRTEEEGETLAGWDVVSGDWSMHSVLDRIWANPDARIRLTHQPEARRSVNPFSLSGKSDGAAAIVVHGYDFWDDYDLSVSGKTLGGEFGLVFDYADASNYYVFRWRIETKQQAPGRVELVKVRGGKEQVLGAKYVLGRCDNWYGLDVRCARGHIQASIDNTPIFHVAAPEAIGGKIGGYARGRRAAIFDDFSVKSVEEMQFNSRAEFDAAAWTRTGDWAVARRGHAVWATVRLAKGQRGLCLLGGRRWTGYLVQARVDAAKLTGAAGLVFGAQSSSDYWEARIDPKTSQAAIVRVTGGKAQTVCQGATRAKLAACHVAVDTSGGGALSLYIDDEIELRCPLAEPITGAVGLAASGEGEASFGALSVFGKRDTDWEAVVQRSIFADDPYMQGWASRRWAWESGKPLGKRTLYVHKGDFFGAFKCEIPVTASFTLRFAEDKFEAKETGYAFDVAFDSKAKTCRAALRRAGKTVWEKAGVPLALIPPPEPQEGEIEDQNQAERKPAFGPLTIWRDGKYIWAAAGDREILNHRDAAPLAGRSVALVGDDALDLSLITMTRDHVLDYLFETAPKDWFKIGTWEVTNRFACDPRWSHMNGRSRGLAALWNKYGIQGDFTLECYAGMRMHQGEMKKGGSGGYPRVGDINICLCGDGQDVFTGYNFILASWDKLWSERWSKLMRLGKVVAKTDKEFIPRNRDHAPQARVIPVPWDPGGRPIHGAWYFLKIRKQGNRLEQTFDGVPVLSYKDPKPLTGKHVALWTQDNSIVVARMKLSYEKREQHAARIVPAPKTEPSFPPADDPIRIRSLTHPSVVADFETGLQGWREAWTDQGAVLSIEPRGKGHCLRLTNAYPGGDAGAEIPAQNMELSHVDRLEFDYRVSPGAKVNLYLQLDSPPQCYYFVHITGPAETSENMRLVANVADAKADGQWRHARIDLAAALCDIEPDRKSFVLQRLFVGNLHEDYLNAGLGGNKAGATYWLDNFSMLGWGPSGAVVEWEPTEGRTFTAYVTCVDQSPNTSPPESTPTANTLQVLPKLPAGVSYFHVKGKRPDGSWSAACHYPLYVSGPLSVAATTPRSGAHWGGGPIMVQFRRDVPADLVLSETKLTVNNQAVPFSAYVFGYDVDKRELTLRLNRTGLSFANSAPVNFALRYQSSLSVTPVGPAAKGAESPEVSLRAGGHAWNYVMDYGLDKTPPSRVTTDKCLVDNDFETSMPWQTYQGRRGATLVRDTSTAASGEASLKLVNHIIGGSFGAIIYKGSFTAGQYPLVSFDYKTDGAARADLYLSGGAATVVHFTDNETSLKVIGSVPDMRTDGKWHHAEFNVKHMLDTAAASYSPHLYNVSQLMFGDWGHAANPPGVFYHIDNFRISPVLCGRHPLTIGLSATDLSGIAGYSFKWSAKPDDAPDHKIDSTQPDAKFPSLPERDGYFHVAAKDNAGNWGPVSHYRFLVDNTLPTVKAKTPAPGSAAAADAITVQVLDDKSGVNPTSFRLSMNDKVCTLKPYQTEYDPVAGVFRWNWVSAQAPMTQPIADKTEMKFALDPVRDFAGNESKPVSWIWHIDYAKDNTGPPPPELDSAKGLYVAHDTFTSSVGQWRTWRRHTVERYFDPQRQDWCLKVAKNKRGGWFWVYARRGYFYTATHPIISFDYKFPKGIKLQMLVYYDRAWHGIELTAAGRYPMVGKAPGIVADGQWRHAAFNLHDMLKATVTDPAKLRPYYLAFVDGMPNQNPPGTTYYIDNFTICGDGPPQPRLTWAAKDPTGIAGVSFTLDRKPASLPDETVDSRDSKLALPVIDAPGLWYVHVRARDGAGNWGAAEHFPYYTTQCAPKARAEGLEADPGWAGSQLHSGASLTVGQTKTISGANQLLAVDYRLRSIRAFTIKLDRKLDLSGKQKLLVDVYHDNASPLSISVQFRTGPKRDWFLAPYQTIGAKGWTQGLAFDLKGKVFRSARSSAGYSSEMQNRSAVSEMALYIKTRTRSGQLLLDNVRFE